MCNIIRSLAVVFLAALLCGCGAGRRDPESVLRQAELSLQAFDFDEARALTQVLDSSAAMTPSQLCREALIYSRLAEACDSPDDMNTALRCYDKALSENADSVRDFTESLDIDNRASFSMLAEIHHALNNPEPPTELDEMEDSIVSPAAYEPRPIIVNTQKNNK